MLLLITCLMVFFTGEVLFELKDAFLHLLLVYLVKQTLKNYILS